MNDPRRTPSVAAALSDPLRLQILDLIRKGRDDRCVSVPSPDFPDAICPYLDVLPQLEGCSTSRLSYHLKVLREADLLTEQRSGKVVFYRLKLETLAGFVRSMQTWLG